MNNREYTTAVENQEYPHDPTVPLGTTFEDARGVIQNLLFTPINSVAVIKSAANTERANHYHQTDNHYAYVISGEVEYSERSLDGDDYFHQSYKAGEMFFSPPQRVHRMYFPVDTVIMTFAKNIRDHEHHEADVVRVKF